MTTVGPAAQAEELAALRDAVRDLAEGAGGVGAARRKLDTESGNDAEAWRLLGQEMGLAGLGLPEQYGGAGGGLPELVTVAEQIGRSVLPVPFLSSTVLAGQILAGCPHPPRGLIERLAGGSALAAFVGLDDDGCWRADRLGVTAAERDGAWTLSGTCSVVLDGADADVLVVAAAVGAGCEVFAVSDADGVQRRRLRTLDPSRAQAEIRLDGARAELLTPDGGGAAIVDAAVDVAMIVLAAEQVGGTQACLEMAADYAKIRHQFSRPIGSFQAVKHALADLVLQVEMGRSALDRALQVGDDPAALREAAAVAQIWCSTAFHAAASANVHVHGGIGFTWEHDAHLFFRRARADEVLFGTATWHRQRLADLLGW